MKDKTPSWVAAESVSGKRLDRRQTYTIIDGAAYADVRYSEACTGCTEAPESTIGPERGSGCDECGYTGRRRRCEGVPV